MNSITDFREWLESTDLSGYNDVYSLYHSVCNIEDFGSYETVKTSNGGYVVTSCDSDMTLFIASEKARETFLKIIEDDYCEGMDIEGYHAFHRAMEKDD